MIRTWMIRPDHDATFAAAMEDVLDVYHRPYDPDHPVICFDECSKELTSDVHPRIQDRHGVRMDPHYERHGMTPLHIWIEPHTGRMGAAVTDRRTRVEFARALQDIMAAYPAAQTITLILDNLNTHTMAAVYAALPVDEAAAIRRTVRLVHTPIHASWLNVAEVAISVMSKAVMVGQRFTSQQELDTRLTAWIADHNATATPITWRMDVDSARARMPRVYPIPLVHQDKMS